MNKIIAIQKLSKQIKKIVLQAPLVADKVRPGQFVVIVIDQKGERIPLTVVESDQSQGTITLIFQEVGQTTCRLGQLKVGDQLFVVLGPLGKATEIKKIGRVLTIGGGVGIAEVYPVTRTFKQAENYVITVIGARSQELLILEKELSQASDRLYVTTDDGTSGRKGLVSDVLKEVLQSEKLDLVYAVGPVPMMQTVSQITKPLKIKTMVSLNPVMVDATGMCGSCRVQIGRESKFACVDGPEFDGHLVDFAQLQNRLNLFREQEKQSSQCAQSL